VITRGTASRPAIPPPTRPPNSYITYRSSFSSPCPHDRIPVRHARAGFSSTGFIRHARRTTDKSLNVSVMNDVFERSCRTMRRPTCRSLAVLGFGVVATVSLSGWLDELWLALLWGLVIGAAYFPLARVKCPACGRFPFTGVINIGGLPLLCFWPDQRCGHCGNPVLV